MFRVNFKEVFNYLFTYLLIGFSGISFFDYNKIGRLGFLMVLAAFFIYYRKKVAKEVIIIVFLAICLVLFQSLYFGGGKLFSSATMIALLIVMPYMAIKLIGPKFLKYYRNIMIFIALVSVIFWVGVNISSGFHHAIRGWASTIGAISNSTWGENSDNIILYTYEEQQLYGILRNPGPFHEPGAFSVFLILAVIAEIFISGKFITRTNQLFIIALLSTFSTAGFLGLFVIVGFYVYTSKKITFATKLFVSAGMLSIVIYLFTTLEFLGEKINAQFDEQTNTQINTATSGRFLGARKAIIVLYRYPLFGRGLLADSKADATSEEAAGYGWITWVSQIGLVLGIIYMFLLYKVLRNYSIINLDNKVFALFAFFALLAVLSGQKHTSALVFFMLFYLPMIYPLNNYANEYKINEK